MKKAKKLLSIILSVTTLLSVLSITVSAGELKGKCGDNVTWVLDTATGVVTVSGEGEMYNYRGLGSAWDNRQDRIRKVIIESGVTTIGSYFLYGCVNLTEVVIPESVLSIGNYAFDLCTALERILIPNSIKTLGVMFVDESVVIDYCGTSTEWIGIKEKNEPYLCRYFVNCQDGKIYPSGKCGDNLTWMIDDSRTLIISGEGEMYDYSYVSEYSAYTNPWGDSAEKAIINEGVTSIGNCAFALCERLLSVEIPNTVKKIGNTAFYKCKSLANVTLGDCVEIIGKCAFELCGLSAVVFPDSVRIIDDMAFENCYSLKTVSIGNGVEIVGISAFEYCYKLTSVEIGENVNSIGKRAFYRCKSLESITVNENNKYYSSDECGVLFNKDKTALITYPLGSAITDYGIPDGVTSIDELAFAADSLDIGTQQSLEKLIIPGSMTTISKDLFLDCFKLTTVIIGEGTKKIETHAFRNLKCLEKIVMPDSLTSIEKEAFMDSRKLKTIIIGQGIEWIPQYVFLNCYKISDIYYTGSEEQWADISIARNNGSFEKAKIHYNCQKVVTPPTCTEEGSVTYTCSCCDVDCLLSHIDPIPTAHNYTEVEMPATCTKHGVTNYTCEYCGDSYFDYTANPTGHTLNEDGVCEICGEKETTTNHVNTQMLTIESVFAMVMNLLAKIFGVFSVA